MPWCVEVLYRYRRVLSVVALVWLGISLWAVTADVLRLTHWGRDLLLAMASAAGARGQWAAMSHTYAGIMGIEPVGLSGHLLCVVGGLAIFFFTMVLFIAPRAGWTAQLERGGAAARGPRWVAALAMSLLSVAWVAGAIDLFNLWQSAGHFRRPWTNLLLGMDNGSLSFNLQTWISLAVIAAGLPTWAWVFKRYLARFDGFWQRAAASYVVFVASGVTLFVGGLLLALRDGFNGQYTATGSFTAAGIGYMVMLWSLIVALVMVRQAQVYYSYRNAWCIGCGYDLKPTLATGRRDCPECGREAPPEVIERAAAERRTQDEQQTQAHRAPDAPLA